MRRLHAYKGAEQAKSLGSVFCLDKQAVQGKKQLLAKFKLRLVDRMQVAYLWFPATVQHKK